MKAAGNKKLPVGIESFEKIRREGFYYVDKTAMIRDLLHKWGEVNLFTRPRRFGKSLNMSMLKAFFEIGADSTLFDGLAISEETELCSAYMGKFPVIFIRGKKPLPATDRSGFHRSERLRHIRCRLDGQPENAVDAAPEAL